MTYRTLYRVSNFILRLWHPQFHISGKENIPQSGNIVICSNHRGMADPFWVILAIDPGRLPRILAKSQLMRIPILGRVLSSWGVVGVRRGENDMTAIKTCLGALKNGESLLVFPEGTRMRPGKQVTPKSGALMLAMRTQTPILPVYIETQRKPFSPMRCVIGAPYLPQTGDRRPAPEEMHRLSGELMKRIYALGAGR